MTKRVTLSVLTVLFFSTAIVAQVTTNERVLKLSSQYLKLEQQLNYARALSLAKEKKWDIEMKLPNGGSAKLMGVDEFGFPKYIKADNNTIAAATTRASALWNGGASGLNLSGSSASMQNKLGIWEFDGAPLSTHVEFGSRINQKDNFSGGSGFNHATHVTGTMIASGVNPIAKGMAFGIPNIIAYEYQNDLSEMTTEAASGLLLSNHSYGLVAGWDFNTAQNRWQFYGRPGENEDYRYGYYSRDAQRIDSIAYNAPNYLIVSSAGNDRNNNGPAVGENYWRYDASFNFVNAGNRPSGISSNDSYDIISGYGVAKNNLTVGAVNGIPGGWNKTGDVVMSSFSAWGPTDDGRIKPDLVADGVSVTSTSSNSTTSYATLSGTSMSAPNATGSLVLLQEYYNRLKTGAFMRSSTLKGLAIHTTDEAGSTPGPDYQFGWGLLNVQRAASVLTNAVSSNNANTSSDLLFEDNLANGASFTRTVVATGRVPLSATICWTDQVASVNTTAATNLNDRTKKLVNDLDVRITQGSRTYFPWILDVSNPAIAAQRGDNITDNVEKVQLDSTIPGQTYTITVSHKGTLARGSQAYALIISGVGGSAYCASSSGGGGARIDSVRFSTINYGNTSGCKTYTDNTALVADLQPLQSTPITIKLSTCDATTNNRFVKVFIDYNNNGTFESTEQVAVSGSLTSVAQNFSANIAVPASVVIGTTTLMRVVVQEAANASDVNACGTYGKGETQDFRVRIVNPSNDMAITNIVSPQGGDCSNSQQYITATFYNAGTNTQTNIPVTATVMNGSTTVATINAIYPGSIAAQSNGNYTFQTPFNAVSGTTYTITVTANLTGDQNSSNN
ncbi:MAG: S8 family serine peptidase, partial [Chitinophagaceae bacterium]|nr:S8 family serine peptidase [Chitinophagaceae bacterium]